MAQSNPQGYPIQRQIRVNKEGNGSRNGSGTGRKEKARKRIGQVGIHSQYRRFGQRQVPGQTEFVSSRQSEDKCIDKCSVSLRSM